MKLPTKLATIAILGAALATAATSISMAWSSAEATQIAPIPVPLGAISNTDRQNYKQGHYLAYAADWSVSTGKISLLRNKDYADRIFVWPALFPAATEIHWQWPNVAPPSGVYGYLHVAYGNYAGGAPLDPIRSLPVDKVHTMTTDIAVTPGKIDGDYNLLTETFLTATPGGSSNHVLEVGFLTHISKRGRIFFNAGKQLGFWTDRWGYKWQVALQGRYCMVIPAQGDVNEAQLDFGGVFRWLTMGGQLTGREWFNGVAIGVEPVIGSGMMKIDRWLVVYK